MAQRVRRVVTGIDEDGRSRFVRDGEPPTVDVQTGRGLIFHELWETGAGAGDIDVEPVNHHPVAGGTKCRIVELLPDEQRDLSRVTEDLDRIAAGDRSVAHSDVTFHQNATVDYNVILTGEVYAVLESDETLLVPGDVLVQRGTAHTWSNRSGQPCVYLSVMVDQGDGATS